MTWGHDYVLLADDTKINRKAKEEIVMRLSNGFVTDKEKTFGEFKIYAMCEMYSVE